MWANVGFSRHVTTAQPFPRNAWPISLKGVRPHSETKILDKDGLQSGHPHLGMPALKPHSCTDICDLLWYSWGLSVLHVFPSFDTLKNKCSWKGRTPTVTKRPWCKVLSYETAKNHSKVGFGGEHQTTLGDLMSSRRWLHCLLCTRVSWCQPLPGAWECVHTCDGADGVRALLSSVLMWPIVHLSRGKHLPLTFIVHLHHGVAGRRQNRPFILKKKRRCCETVSKAIRQIYLNSTFWIIAGWFIATFNPDSSHRFLVSIREPSYPPADPHSHPNWCHLQSDWGYPQSPHPDHW